MSEVDHGDHTHPGMDTEELSYHARRVHAMETLLAEKGVLTIEEVQRNVDNVESRSPADGARVVARAWANPAVQGQAAVGPGGGTGRDGLRAARPDAQAGRGGKHRRRASPGGLHPLLLLPPRPAGAARQTGTRASPTARGPSLTRAASLREFGTEVSDDTEVVVLDSTADLRYLVLPQQPAGTDGMSEEELAALVTRDSMIGVSRALAPELVAADD